MTRDIDEDSGLLFIRVNHPAPGDVVRDPVHVAGYGTAFEGTISLRVRDDDGTIIASGTAQGGSNGCYRRVQGEPAVRPQAKSAARSCGGFRGER